MLDLTHAKSIQINGKEVKKLEIGNRVIWEKKTFESLILSASSNIVSAGDTVTLSAQLADANSNPVSVIGERVEFITDELPIDEWSDSEESIDFQNSYYVELSSGNSISFLTEDIQVHLRSNNILITDNRLYNVDDFSFTGGYVIIENMVIKDCNHNVICDLTQYTSFTEYTYYGTASICELIGSGITNAQGLVTVSYLVQGSEPLSIKAKCGIILSEICEVFIYLYDPSTYSCPHTCNVNEEFLIECEIYPKNYWTWTRLFLQSEGTATTLIAIISSSYDVNGTAITVKDVGYNNWIPIKLECKNDVATLFVNNTQRGTLSIEGVEFDSLLISGSYPVDVRNIKLVSF